MKFRAFGGQLHLDVYMSFFSGGGGKIVARGGKCPTPTTPPPK